VVHPVGIDEISYGGHKYLTLVYQLDQGCRRLLWSGPERRVKTLIRFFRWFGKERSELLEYVSSDRMNHCLPHVGALSEGDQEEGRQRVEYFRSVSYYEEVQ